MVRWVRWHCPPDTGFEIRALAVWGRARYFSVTEAPHNTDFHTWMGKKHFLFLLNRRDREPNPELWREGSGANHYPRAPPPYTAAKSSVSPALCAVLYWAARTVLCDLTFVTIWHDSRRRLVNSGGSVREDTSPDNNTNSGMSWCLLSLGPYSRTSYDIS